MLNLMRSSVLVVLVLAVGGAAAAAPALATPTSTSSTGSSPVTPFITPIGNTISSTFSAIGTRMDYSALALGGAMTATVTCTPGSSGYIPGTHTRLLLVSFGGITCTSSFGGTTTVSSSTASATPWPVHLSREVRARSSSWGGTLEIPSGGNLVITVVSGPVRCTITILPQSIVVAYTNPTRALTVTDATVRFVLSGDSSATCPDPARTMTIIGTVTPRSSTMTDEANGAPRVTAAS
jgi:hypothetical protein